MHHFESMPSLHLPSTNDSFPTSPPASPMSFTSTPSVPEKRSRHTHRRSLAISSHMTFPKPSAIDQNPAMITPPLSSPALSFPKTSSLESLRSGTTMLDYDSDVPRTPIADCASLRAMASNDTFPPKVEETEDVILSESDLQGHVCVPSPTAELPVKLRKVAFNDAIIYYPPRPMSSRQPSFSSQISQHSSRETTPSISSPELTHRRSLSSFLLPSPTFLPSTHRRHTRERKSWAGLIASPFTSARRRRSPNHYRPPTPPLGHEGEYENKNDGDDDDDYDDDDDDRFDSWQPSIPVIDLDAALGPFQTPASPIPTGKFWSLTSHVGSHRRSESAPEIRGPGLDSFSSSSGISDEDLAARGLKRKMSVIDEEDRQSKPEEVEIDNELHRIILQEGAEMGEMGDLVVDPAFQNTNTTTEGKLQKRRSWRRSLREWWKKV